MAAALAIACGQPTRVLGPAEIDYDWPLRLRVPEEVREGETEPVSLRDMLGLGESEGDAVELGQPLAVRQEEGLPLR